MWFSQDLNPLRFKDWTSPKSPTEIRQFLGLAGYYRRFIEGFSKIAKPMTKLTQKKVKFEWGDKQEQLFSNMLYAGKEREPNALRVRAIGYDYIRSIRDTKKLEHVRMVTMCSPMEKMVYLVMAICRLLVPRNLLGKSSDQAKDACRSFMIAEELRCDIRVGEGRYKLELPEEELFHWSKFDGTPKEMYRSSHGNANDKSRSNITTPLRQDHTVVSASM
ncbi:hypothetical protein Tco_0465585 [Tanacetum coccineum]